MKLTKEQVMVANGMNERGTSVRQLARQLGVTEGALRYRLKKLEEGPQEDGRSRQATALDGYEAVVEGIQVALEDGRLTGEGRPSQARTIYELLVRDHGYEGSYQSVVRHLRRKHGAPRVRALRRVETPPGVQAQHDWFEVPRVPIGGRRRRLQALIGTLSYSRGKFCWASEEQSQLAWHTAGLRCGRRRSRSRDAALAVFVVSTIPGCGGTQQAAPTAEPATCPESPVPVPAPVQCHHVTFAEHSRENGAERQLFVVVAGATTESRSPDPIFFIAGGPGQAASGVAGYFTQQMAELRESRDIVFIDHRGTGLSGALQCPTLADPPSAQAWIDEFLLPARYQACLETLQRQEDLTRYTTAIIADDIDVVRRALGYERVNLFGGSYGAEVALEIIRRHGAGVRSAVLEAPGVDLSRHLVETPVLLEAGIDTLVADCARDPRCASAYPDLRQSISAALGRFEDGPVTAVITDPATGGEETVRLTRENFADGLRFSLYYGAFAAEVPRNLTRAARGDFTSYAQTVAQLSQIFSSQTADAMNISVRCAEVAPFTDPDEARRLAEGTMLGTQRLDRELGICDFWPRGSVPENHRSPVSSDVPVLMVAGAWDVTASPDLAESAAAHLSNGLFVRAPRTRHDVMSLGPCLHQMRRVFIETADPGAVDASCVEAAERPAYVLPA
ncbi:MAG: alpha/beta fold hydrolase [Gemmatimonadetes bacterium]|nr:alpha/beta fold hydrolase [Gemmatimonadota bacterium]